MMRRLLIALCFLASPLVAKPKIIESARPWLGVAIDTGTQGVLVKEVLKDTPAATAGIEVHDEILAVDTTKVHKPEELILAVQSYGIGSTVTVLLLRQGKNLQKAIKLVARPDELAMLREQLTGKTPPPFDLPVVHGTGPGSSKALGGKVTILEFWATWCPACRSTHPRLSSWASEHKNKANVIAISDEPAPTLTSYAAQTHPAFSLLSDTQNLAAKSYLVSAIPQLVVLNPQGQVVFATIGAGESLEEALATAEKLLK